MTVAGGTPSLFLRYWRNCDSDWWFDTNQLSFTYTVEAGQNTADLAVTAFNLNGATLKDAQGNDADTAGALTNPDGTLVVDTTAPTAPTISQVTDDVAPVTGTVADGGSTNDSTPTVRISLGGTAAVAGDNVQLFNGMTALGSAVILSSGDIATGFTYITPASQNDGTYAFNAKITDTVGNTSAPSAAFNVTVDTSAPTAAVSITAIEDDTARWGTLSPATPH